MGGCSPFFELIPAQPFLIRVGAAHLDSRLVTLAARVGHFHVNPCLAIHPLQLDRLPFSSDGLLVLSHSAAKDVIRNKEPGGQRHITKYLHFCPPCAADRLRLAQDPTSNKSVSGKSVSHHRMFHGFAVGLRVSYDYVDVHVPRSRTRWNASVMRRARKRMSPPRSMFPTYHCAGRGHHEIVAIPTCRRVGPSNWAALTLYGRLVQALAHR